MDKKNSYISKPLNDLIDPTKLKKLIDKTMEEIEQLNNYLPTKKSIPESLSAKRDAMYIINSATNTWMNLIKIQQGFQTTDEKELIDIIDEECEKIEKSNQISTPAKKKKQKQNENEK